VQVALQPEAAESGFVDEAQGSAAGELLDQPIDGVLLCADLAEIDGWLSGVAADARGGDGVFVNVQSDEDGGIVFHADLRFEETDFERTESTLVRLWQFANPR